MASNMARIALLLQSTAVATVAGVPGLTLPGLNLHAAVLRSSMNGSVTHVLSGSDDTCNDAVTENERLVQETLEPKLAQLTLDIRLEFYVCITGDASRVSVCTEGKSAKDLEDDGEILKCLKAMPTSENFGKCSEDMTASFRAKASDFVEMTNEAFTEICEIHGQPLCIVTQRVSGIKQQYNTCIPDSCTLAQLQELLAERVNAMTACKLLDEACTATVQCPNDDSWSWWVWALLLLIFGGLVGAAVFVHRKRSNAF